MSSQTTWPPELVADSLEIQESEIPQKNKNMDVPRMQIHPAQNVCRFSNYVVGKKPPDPLGAISGELLHELERYKESIKAYCLLI